MNWIQQHLFSIGAPIAGAAALHVALKQGGVLKAALTALLARYPALKQFVKDHGPDIIKLAQQEEKEVEEVVNDAQK